MHIQVYLYVYIQTELDKGTAMRAHISGLEYGPLQAAAPRPEADARHRGCGARPKTQAIGRPGAKIHRRK